MVVTVVNTVDAARAGNPDPPGSRWVQGLTAKVREQLPEGDGVVEIRAIGGAGSGWIGAGIADELEHDGIETRVAPDLEFAYGPDRVLDGEHVRLTVLPVEDPELAAAPAAPVLRRRRAGREVHAVREGSGDVPGGILTRSSIAQSRTKSTSQSAWSVNSGWSRLVRMQSSSTRVSISVRMKHR